MPWKDAGKVLLSQGQEKQVIRLLIFYGRLACEEEASSFVSVGRHFPFASTKQNSRFYTNFLRDFSSEFVTNLRYTIFPRYSSFAAVAARPLPQQFLLWGHSLFQSFKQ